MNDVKNSILAAIGTYKIKYNVLDNLFNDDEQLFLVKNKSTKAFHIDLSCMLHVLENLFNDIDNEYTVDELSVTVCSSIINTVAHYRSYFAKNKVYDVSIFLYHNKEKYKSNSIINDVIKKSINQLQIIFKYIPKVYLISNTFTNIDSNVSMRHFISLYDNNLIMTKNKLLYQYLNYDKKHSKSIEILKPHRDNSYLINEYNWYKYFYDGNDKYMSPDFIPMILSLCGLKNAKTKIEGLKGFGPKRSYNKIYKLYDAGKIFYYYRSTDDLIYDMELDDEDQIKYIKQNYYILNLNNQYNSLKKVDKIKLDECIVDNFSRKDLKSLNLIYFTGLESLMLQELLIGITDIKSKKIIW